jgi:protein regulator of cytokinesis 1
MDILPSSGAKNGGEASSPIVKFRISSPSSSTRKLQEQQQGLQSSSFPYLKSPTSASRKHSTTFTTSFVQTPSGPVLTPADARSSNANNRSTMILLSPSRTIADSLTALAASTAQNLEQVWDEVGYNPEERASQLSDLLRQFRNLCDEKISEERGVAETFRAEIFNAQQELQQTGKALKRLVDPQLLRETLTGQSLTDQLASIEQTLEGLREAAAVAREDLSACQQYLMESYEALGWEQEEEWKDVDSDWTVERREAFHVKVAEIKQQIATRTDAVVALVQDCQHFLHELRMDVEATPLDRRIAGSLVLSKDNTYMLTSKVQNDTCVGIGSTVLEDLTQRAAELSAERKLRKTKLQEMGTEIATLWEKLRISEDEQREFTQGIQGLGMDTIVKGEEELERLHALKGAMLGKLIVEARERIASLWVETNTTLEQQKTFKAYKDTQESFELLDLHDDYVIVLEGRLEQMQPILRILERRAEILAERMEYEELQHNSERLQQRGAALTKQLMREEKMAKRIKRELPKLSSMLEDKLFEWKREHREDFQYGGEVYLEVMDRQEEEWKSYKESEMKAKLMKKQEERALAENRYGKSKGGNALPGKKRAKPFAVKNQ